MVHRHRKNIFLVGLLLALAVANTVLAGEHVHIDTSEQHCTTCLLSSSGKSGLASDSPTLALIAVKTRYQLPSLTSYTANTPPSYLARAPPR